MTNILNYYGEAHTPFLHAKGRAATLYLIEMLDCKPGERILEVGFGTGATLAILASEYKETKLFGTDASVKMFEITSKRLRFCGLKNKVSLAIMTSSLKLPYEENYFDKIYIESVLAIQENNKLHEMLTEIKRILKPGGMLVMNETIWLVSTPLQKIEEVNEFCKHAFGVIQANALFPYIANWKLLLENLNFELREILDLDSINTSFEKHEISNFRSFLFSYTGKIKSRCMKLFSNVEQNYQNQINFLGRNSGQLMKGYLLKVKLNK